MVYEVYVLQIKPVSHDNLPFANIFYKLRNVSDGMHFDLVSHVSVQQREVKPNQNK